MLEYSWPCTRGVCLMLTLSTHSYGTALSGFAFVWFGQILPGHQVIPINFAVCIIFFQLRPTTLHLPSCILYPPFWFCRAALSSASFGGFSNVWSMQCRHGDGIAFSLRSELGRGMSAPKCFIFLCVWYSDSFCRPAFVSFTLVCWESFYMALMELVYGFCASLADCLKSRLFIILFLFFCAPELPIPLLCTHLIMCIYSEINFYFTVAGKHGSKKKVTDKKGKKFLYRLRLCTGN